MGDGDRAYAVFAYLVMHPDGAILVDTGIGSGNPLIDNTYTPKRNSLQRALAAHGVALSDVAAVVNSHLHFDHCGQNALFAGRPVYARAAEIEAAKGRYYTVREWFEHPGADLQPVEGELEIAQGVTLLPSPGHTVGHQSVWAETPGGATLVCAQAAYNAAEWRRGANLAEAQSGLEPDYRQSHQRLSRLRPARVVFSHDSEDA